MAEKNKFNNLDDEDMFVTLDLDDKAWNFDVFTKT